MAEETLQGVAGKPRPGGDSPVRINADVCLIILLIGVGFLLRITTPLYNTASVDESNAILIGQNFLVGDFSQRATTWMLGSYLYPIIAVLLSAIGGLEGLRILSAGLNAIAVSYIYFSTKQLFGISAALWASLLFGFCTISMNLGQFAIGDALALPMLCISFYCIVMAGSKSPVHVDLYLLSASAAFIVAALAKYLLLLYLPALVLLSVVLLLMRGWSASPTLTPFLGPIVVVIMLYTVYYQADISLALVQYFSETGDRARMLQTIWDEAGIPLVLGLAGAFVLPHVALPRPGMLDRRIRQIMWLILPILVIGLFALPLVALAFATTRNLWENLLPTLALTAPLAGYGIATVTERVRATRGRSGLAFRFAGLAITIAGLWWIANVATARHWGWQHSWPNVERTVSYLELHSPTDDGRVLAEGAPVYQFYLRQQKYQPTTWDNTWAFGYNGQNGLSAMQIAIRDHYFDRVILDSYYTPTLTAQLVPTLLDAGYTLSFQDTQTLTTGQIAIQVYERPEVPR
ncbi:MAG: glycosyltransferase family 39 protein [Roseiflexaceae bacterium]|nr:glycosyltransferase family 39 protein [Roseiflexaceae bacterium]